MLNFNQFSDLTLRTLQEMRKYSAPAHRAIMMIVAHESAGGTYLRQLEGGPARGIIQMEPATHDSIWDNADGIKANADLMNIRRNLAALEYDLRYNIFMARSMLLMDPDPLPLSAGKLSVYLKRVYNTPKGAADDMSYFDAMVTWRGTL